jgi:hypothetical protein
MALGLLAAKPTNPQVDNYATARDREIGEMTFVVAVQCF